MLYNPVKPLFGMIIVGWEVLKACVYFFFLCAFYFIYELLEYGSLNSHILIQFTYFVTFHYSEIMPVATRRTRKDCKTHWWRKTKKWTQ